MEITKEQIQQIETYLQKRKVDFIDLKVEILDHMISDIEQLMSKNHSFENALKMTTIKWERHFTNRSSFYFGYWYSESKIVVNKAVKEFKKFYFLYFASYFLPLAFLENVAIQFEKSTVILINQMVVLLTFLSLSYILFIFIKTTFSKQKTTYHFILKTQFTGAIFLVIFLFLGDLFQDNRMLQPIFTGFTFASFVVTYICHHFYKKHQAVVEKYKIL